MCPKQFTGATIKVIGYSTARRTSINTRELWQYSCACFFLLSSMPFFILLMVSLSLPLFLVHRKTFRRSNLIKQVFGAPSFPAVAHRRIVRPSTSTTVDVAYRRSGHRVTNKIANKKNNVFCVFCLHIPSVHVGCGICVPRLCFR